MKRYYELTPSQETNILQMKFTLHKRVINILSSLDFDFMPNEEILLKTWNIVIERNDCLRLVFKKRFFKYYQRFEKERVVDHIDKIVFNSQEEFASWYLKYRKWPIKFRKGNVGEPTFIILEGKFKMFFKFCHLVTDVHGISILYNEILSIYSCLQNGKDYNAPIFKFEDLVKKDIEIKNDKERNKNEEKFYKEYLENKEEPFYASPSGDNDPVWWKRYKKGKHNRNMDLIKSDTFPSVFVISSEIASKVLNYSAEKSISPATILYYIYLVIFSYINDKVPYLFSLFLSNCRGSIKEKKCAGTKVQSMANYAVIDYNKSFYDNLASFNEIHNRVSYHVGFSDMKMDKIMRSVWHMSPIATYYPLCYSYIPFKALDNASISMYSNGKGALMTYIAHMHNIDTNEIICCYDCNRASIDFDSVNNMHSKFLNAINVLLDSNLQLKEIEI